MPTIAQQSMLTLVELAKNIDPQGNLLKVAEILTRTDRIWDDIPWFEANDIFSHLSGQEYSEPTGDIRVLNDGVGLGTVQTENIRDVLAMVEKYAESDVALVNAAPDPRAYRNARAAKILRGVGKTFIDMLITGNALTVAGACNGLQIRLDALSQKLVVDGGGTGSDLTSIYVIQWGEGKVNCRYPRGSEIGLQHRDLGEVTAQTAAGLQFQAYRDWFKVHGGLVVEDYRCIGRYANIETSGTTNTFNEDLLIELMNYMYDDWAGAAIYCNSTVMTQMEIRAKDKSNVSYTFADAFGAGPILMFKGVPIRKVEAITNTENAVS